MLLVSFEFDKFTFSSDPHFPEYRNAMNCKDIKLKVSLIQNLAYSGNPFAAEIFGDWFMVGLWDKNRMAMDLAYGDLLPETSDPTKDPYLIIGSDRFKAREFHRIAAEYIIQPGTHKYDEIKHVAIRSMTKSNAFDRELQRLNLSSDKEKESDYKDFRPIAEMNLDSFLFSISHRPKVSNPITKIFENIAEPIWLDCKHQMISVVWVFFLIQMLHSSWRIHTLKDFSTDFVLQNFIFLVLLAGPNLVIGLLIRKYGIQYKLPVCSCNSIQEAFSVKFDLSRLKNPFKTTPLLIRNLLLIKHYIFWSYLVLVVALITLHFVFEFNFFDLIGLDHFYYPRFYISLLFWLCISIIVWDKKVPQRLNQAEVIERIVMVPLSFVFFVCDDKHCCAVAEEIKLGITSNT